jgi:hypothetical protein
MLLGPSGAGRDGAGAEMPGALAADGDELLGDDADIVLARRVADAVAEAGMIAGGDVGDAVGGAHHRRVVALALLGRGGGGDGAREEEGGKGAAGRGNHTKRRRRRHADPPGRQADRTWRCGEVKASGGQGRKARAPAQMNGL